MRGHRIAPWIASVVVAGALVALPATASAAPYQVVACKQTQPVVDNWAWSTAGESPESSFLSCQQADLVDEPGGPAPLTTLRMRIGGSDPTTGYWRFDAPPTTTIRGVAASVTVAGNPNSLTGLFTGGPTPTLVSSTRPPNGGLPETMQVAYQVPPGPPVTRAWLGSQLYVGGGAGIDFDAGDVQVTLDDSTAPAIVVDAGRNHDDWITGAILIPWQASDAGAGLLRVNVGTTQPAPNGSGSGPPQPIPSCLATIAGTEPNPGQTNAFAVAQPCPTQAGGSYAVLPGSSGLSDGTSMLFFTATDLVGNSTTDFFVAKVDTTPPVVQLQRSSNDSSPQVGWAADDQFSGIVPSAVKPEYSTDGSTWKPMGFVVHDLATKTVKAQVPADVPSGPVHVRLTATDQAGNTTTTPPTTIQVTPQTAAPPPPAPTPPATPRPVTCLTPVPLPDQSRLLGRTQVRFAPRLPKRITAQRPARFDVRGRLGGVTRVSATLDGRKLSVSLARQGKAGEWTTVVPFARLRAGKSAKLKLTVTAAGRSWKISAPLSTAACA